jgi:hypothetical protein
MAAGRKLESVEVSDMMGVREKSLASERFLSVRSREATHSRYHSDI